MIRKEKLKYHHLGIPAEKLIEFIQINKNDGKSEKQTPDND